MSQPTHPATPHPAAGLPWWRIGWMWLVVGIPALTVVAAIATITLAVVTGDPSVRTPGDQPPVHLRQANEQPHP